MPVVEAVSRNRFTGEEKRWTIEYAVVPNPPRGGMKKVYFSTDGRWALQFFHDPQAVQRHHVEERLAAILGAYNPTLPQHDGGAVGSTEQTAKYFRQRYCWPESVVHDPDYGFGIVCPVYPARFRFGEDVSTKAAVSKVLKGKDKKSSWYLSANTREALKPEQLGDFRRMLQISLELARAVRRLHAAGLAHSDLSGNNVLIDPPTGNCVVIDIDSLVVPGLYPPEVAGTKGYIAPEVLETQTLDWSDPAKRLPCRATDLHALAVLIYQFLLLRHPLEGKKTFDPDDPERDEFLMMGPNALFIENPHDTSNRPANLSVTIADLGSGLAELFLRTFVDGLHHPRQRVPASAWENALSQALELLQPCENRDCSMGWFILHDPKNPICPFCKTAVPPWRIIQLRQLRPIADRPGQWQENGIVNAYDKKELFQWHFFPHAPRGEMADANVWARIERRGKDFVLFNQKLPDLHLANGDPVPPGRGLLLRPGVAFRSAANGEGLLVEVRGA